METMRLDKDVLHKGDRLYDLIEGVVEVVDVRDGTILCTRRGTAAAPAPIMQYSADGVKARARVRTLYWHDPRVALPRKDAALWASQMQIIQSILDSFGSFVSSAAVATHETYDPQVSSALAARDRGLLTGTECRQLIDALKSEHETSDNEGD